MYPKNDILLHIFYSKWPIVETESHADDLSSAKRKISHDWAQIPIAVTTTNDRPMQCGMLHSYSLRIKSIWKSPSGEVRILKT